MHRIRLPWYYFAFLRAEYDALFAALLPILREEGFADLPSAFDGHLDLDGLLISADLLVSQTCGYDIAVDLPQRLQTVLTPVFNLKDCPAGMYRSLIVVPRPSRITSMNDRAVEGARFVANDERSWSGYHCVHEDWSRFKSIEFSGSHQDSMAWLNAGRADLAAIDEVTWTLFEMYQPEALINLKVIGRTDPAPAPPLVTRADLGASNLNALRRAFRKLARTYPEVCAKLCLKDFVYIAPEAYQMMSRPIFSVCSFQNQSN